MFDYFRNYSSNPHHVRCEDNPTKSLCDHCQSNDLYLHSRLQVCFQLLFNLQQLRQYLSYYIQTWHDGYLINSIILIQLVLMTLMQGHSGSARQTNQRCMLSVIKQAISINLAATVDHLLTRPWLCKQLYGLTILFSLLWRISWSAMPVVFCIVVSTAVRLPTSNQL